MYKLFKDTLTDTYSIHKVGTQISFLPDPANREYQQFVNDIYKKGIGIVEGADYVGVTTYTEARAAEYPPIVDQLDKIYHSGIDAWKTDIKVIKDKYPKTQVGITSIAPIPDWVKTVLFDKQKEEYIKATTRLAKYELSEGVKDENGYYIIDPLPIIVENERNPLVVLDEKQRAAAQKVINNTPQVVIDSVSS
tara:strand:+ start:963 stop:1541 length:579 start_codon:yes stop_codon:yes gene_type:complete